MKILLKLNFVVFLLWGILATAQQPSPAAVTVPYAGATISDFTGKVSIQLPTQALASPSRGQVLPPESVVTTDSGKLLLRLSDGSDVIVRPHTRLVVKQPETSGWRYVQLLMGRIRTQVQKRLGGAPGFKIGTPSAVISVRGTKFDVEVNRHGVTEVDVDEGVVELDSLHDLGQPVMITAGFSSRVGMDSAPEVPRPTHDLRPDLDRPGHMDQKDGDDGDDFIKKLEAADNDRHDQSGRDSDGGSSGSGSSGSSGSGDQSSGSGKQSDDGPRHEGPPQVPQY